MEVGDGDVRGVVGSRTRVGQALEAEGVALIGGDADSLRGVRLLRPAPRPPGRAQDG